MITRMIHPVSGPVTRRHPAAALALVLLVAGGWYAMQPIYPDCFYMGDISYSEAVDAGYCKPPQMRWETWIK